jgi:predicted amidohydrolase YtcJ
MALLFYDLHTGVGTRAAMQAAGLTGAREFGDTSEVVVDAAGLPTGELREPPAYNLLLAAAPPLTDPQLAARSLDTFRQMNRCGLTGAVIMDGTPNTLALLRRIEASGELPIRLNVALWHRPDSDDTELAVNITRLGMSGRRWTVSLIKMFIDGVIDTGTAWLHEPDTCGQGTRAFWPSIDRYREVVHRYTEAGYQIATHAVGDQGVAVVLDAYETYGAESNFGAAHRIEHLETLTDDEVQRLAATGVVASMQPLHMQWRAADQSDSWATRLGHDRAEHGFRIGDILTAGGRVALGSDWPVAPFDPRLGMAWARLRRTPGRPDGRVFEPSQRLPGEQALLGYTRWAAEALGRTDVGTIIPGAHADLTVFEDNPVTAPADDLTRLPVVLTVVGGQIVHREGL